MTLFILVVLWFAKGTPAIQVAMFPSQSVCETAEASIADQLVAQPGLTGWTTLRGCEAVEEPRGT